MPPASKVELYAAIRRDVRAGTSARAIERKHGVGRADDREGDVVGVARAA